MFEALSAVFTLRWTQQPPQLRPLPAHIHRTFVLTPSGELELLVYKPREQLHRGDDPPVFFVHGGYGSASVWLEWMTHLHNSGYSGTLYAFSVRNHGASYSLPYWRMVFQTSFDDIVADFLTCYKHALELEAASSGSSNLVLIGHSSGGGLVQYVLSKGLAHCRALCLVDAIPHFGSYPVYWNWFKHDKWFPLRSWLHLQHPTSPLSTPSLVRGAFFGKRYAKANALEFMRWMPAYESMGWPLGMLGSFLAWLSGRCQWLDPAAILKHIGGTTDEGRGKDAVCVMVGSEDMMMDYNMCKQQVREYSEAMQSVRQLENVDLASLEKPSTRTPIDGVTVQRDGGARLVVVEGAGHHMQNDLQHVAGAEAFIHFLRQC